jgi:hypothetical protein
LRRNKFIYEKDFSAKLCENLCEPLREILICEKKFNPMISFKKKPQNYLTMIPVRNVQVFDDIEGKITLLIPKFKPVWLRKWLIPKHKSPHFRIHLDETGSHVWRLINGKQTIEKICLEMSQVLQREERPVDQIEVRITTFMTDLYKKKFIFFEKNIINKKAVGSEQ